MDFQYFIVYLVVNVVCIAFSITLLTRLTSNIGSEIENKLFRRMLIMYMAFLACEIIWVVGQSGIIPMSLHFCNSVKIAGTAFIPIMVYFWFRYAEIGFENKLSYNKMFAWITFIPAGIMILIYLSSPITGLIAKIEPDGTVINGPMIALTGIIDNIYGIAVVVHAVILIFKNKNELKRRIYLTHIMFIVICTIGGIADTVISNTPIMPLAILLSYNVLFINLQESKIFNDSVTGLNNRRMADEFLAEAIDDATENKPFCLMMMDIDGFKNVNDKFGHLEGDRALKITSDCMKKVATEWNGFLARWGGDEFMVVMKTRDNSLVEGFLNALRDELKKATKENSLTYSLEISVGKEFCNSKDIEAEELVRKADEKLYEAKALRGIETGEWIRL